MDVINLRGMRVVYSERVYRALAIIGFGVNERHETKPQKCKKTYRSHGCNGNKRRRQRHDHRR